MDLCFGSKTDSILSPDLGVKPVADQHSKILDAWPPLSPISFIFIQFAANFGQILG